MKPLTRTKYEEEIRRLRRENVKLSKMILAESPQCECERLRAELEKLHADVEAWRNEHGPCEYDWLGEGVLISVEDWNKLAALQSTPSMCVSGRGRQ